MGLLLLRYGEIALKGQNRTYFYRRLRHNVRRCLAANGIAGQVWQEGQRIFLETDQVEAAVEAVQRVFGVVSLSPAEVAPADLDAIIRQAVGVARKAGLDASRSFHVRARRADKQFLPRSPDIERSVGAAVVEATGARVDLSDAADLKIGIEVQPGRAVLFGQTIPGPGGLPVGSQGRVVALLSSGIDSPVALWLVMKRGCRVIPVHFGDNPAQADQVQEVVEVLNRYSYGRPLKPVFLSHQDLMAPILPRLRELRAQRWTCLFCKRAMLAKAAELAEAMGAAALVTGESLGQVASQTVSNLEVISYGISKPILRPLIGLDKSETMALARRIGTYDVSIRRADACPYLPAQPLTRARLVQLKALLEQMSVPSSQGDQRPEPNA